MASSGKAAWEKYYRDRSVETFIKKEGFLYDMDDINKKTSVKVSPDEPIIVKETFEYPENGRMPIEYKGNDYRYNIDSILKPGSENLIKLKPQDFTTIARQNTFNNVEVLKNSLLNEIRDNDNFSADLKVYLSELLRYWSGENIKVSPYKGAGTNEIKKDFGEILGAIAHASGRIGFLDVQKIIFTTKGNEPLIDYQLQIKASNRVRLMDFSAKAEGKTTNTVKPRDILNLIKNKNLENKWKNTEIYKFVQLVDEKKILEFPFHAYNFIKKKEIISKKSLDKIEKLSASNLTIQLNKLILDNVIKSTEIIDILKDLNINGNFGNMTLGELYYELEKYATKNGPDPKELFLDAISGVITYVMFSINSSNPMGQFNIRASNVFEQSKNNEIFWRTKNARTRAGDKIGVQP